MAANARRRLAQPGRPPPPPRSHGTCAAAASGGSAGWLWSVGACQATCPACCWFGCTGSRRPTCECRPAAHCPAPRAPLALQGDPLCRPAPMVAMYYSARVFCTDSIRRERMQPLCSLTLRSFGLCLCGCAATAPATLTPRALCGACSHGGIRLPWLQWGRHCC